jgi:hypothetical protein
MMTTVCYVTSYFSKKIFVLYLFCKACSADSEYMLICFLKRKQRNVIHFFSFSP